MTREEALEELKLRLSNKDILQHSMAVEAVMKEFANHYNADADMWGMAGLLHDIDYEKTANNPSLHGIIGAEIIENLDIDDAVVYSVRAHNDYHGIPRKRKMDKVLFLADPVSNLIIESALILPGKRLADVTVDFVINKMNETYSKENSDRGQIKQYEELEMTPREFIKIALKAIQGVSKELGFNC